MRRLIKQFRPVAMSLLIFTILCGILYTALVTGFAQLVFPDKANGSILTVTLKDGTKKQIGSEQIAQEFTKPEYLIGRPSGPSNLSPVGAEQQKQVQSRIDWWHTLDPENLAEIPADLVMSSASGVDPAISPEAAEYQVARIAKTRGISEETVRGIIQKFTKDRFLGFWGEPSVNVLQVNLALDGLL